MAKIEFVDWETWQSENPSKRNRYNFLEYLRDDKRIGEWRRVFQYIILPSRNGIIRAYDVFVDEPSSRWKINHNPNSVKLVRWQVYKRRSYATKFEHKIVDFPVNEFHKIGEGLEALVMPSVFSKPTYSISGDGVNYEFEFNSPALRLRYHWWSLPQKGIRTLADYCYKMNRNFETHLEQADKYE